MELSGFYTFKQLASDVLIDKYGAIDTGRYHQLIRWAVRKYIDLKIHLLPENKPVKLTVIQDPYSVRLPDDYVRFHAIGVDNNGEFVPFHQNSKMAMYVAEDCGSETQGTEEQQEQLGYPIWYSYSLDEQNQRVLLHGYPYLDEVILLYVSTGVRVGEETVIHAKIYEVLIAWLHYQLSKHAGGSAMDIQESWATYLREMNKFTKTKFDLGKMYDILFDVGYRKS